MRDLRAASVHLNATIIAAARQEPRFALRVAPVSTLDAAMSEARALMAVPSLLAGQVSGVVMGLACADVWGNPQAREIIIGAEALEAIRAAEIALDDALLDARLTQARRATPDARSGNA